MWKTLEYIWKSTIPLDKFLIGPYREIEVASNRCYKFEPYSNHREPKVLVFIPGMTVRGIDDPRMIKQCEIFRQLGYTVFLPHFPEIQELRITPQSIRNIDRVIKTILNMYPAKKIDLMSISFSGALTLIAATGEEIRDSIDSIMLVGTFANFRTACEYLMLNLEGDPYGYYIILSNLLPYTEKYNIPALYESFSIAAYDNALKRNPPLLEKHFQKHPEIKPLFEEFVHSREKRKEVLDIIFHTPSLQEINRQFDVLPHIKNLKAKVILLHGKNDNVIPPEESVLIYRECQKHNIPARIVLTSLLDHGNVKPGLGLINEFLHLLNALNFFIK